MLKFGQANNFMRFKEALLKKGIREVWEAGQADQYGAIQ
jgi:hypothetical protein